MTGVVSAGPDVIRISMMNPHCSSYSLGAWSTCKRVSEYDTPGNRGQG